MNLDKEGHLTEKSQQKNLRNYWALFHKQILHTTHLTSVFILNLQIRAFCQLEEYE